MNQFEIAAISDVIYWLAAVRADAEDMEAGVNRDALLSHLFKAEFLIDEIAMGNMKAGPSK